MIGKQPDPKALKALGDELATGTSDVRKKIIDLLEDIKALCHPGREELRNTEIIALLVGPGFAKTDAARGYAMDMLSEYSSPATLSRYGDIFLKALKEEPESSALQLIAKAKVMQAKEEIDRLSRLPEWKDEGWMHIARAALGDTKIEDAYIARATEQEATGSAHLLNDSLMTLAWIGTPRSLRFICQRMRSPLIRPLAGPTASRSIRLDVMDALTYIFPGEPALFSGGVTEEEDYTRAEQFCTREFGVQYDDIPRPEFFTESPHFSED
jgi:hypothetical protein